MNFHQHPVSVSFFLFLLQVDLLNYEDGKGRRPDNQSPGQDGAKLEVARNAALALWSCSKSTRSRYVT